MITDYVVMITAVTVCAVCFIVKQFIPEKYEKFIPLGAGVLGVLFNWWVMGEMTPLTFTQGLISGLGATGLWEMIKIPMKLKEEVVADGEN